jgi:GAF domain-containing protein
VSEHPGTTFTAAEAFAELAELSVSAEPLMEILQRTVELALAVIAAQVEVSVTVIAGDDARTPAATAAIAAKLDEVQYRAGHGPCLDSARAGQLVLIDDMSVDHRWPEFRTSAVELGIRSSLSVPLPVQRQVIGALNVYAHEPQTFKDERVQLAERFASYAAVAIGNTSLYMTSAKLASQMHDAMASRAVIEQAKGILMAVHKCDADEAFARLTQASQHTHRKLRDVARELVERAVE